MPFLPPQGHGCSAGQCGPRPTAWLRLVSERQCERQPNLRSPPLSQGEDKSVCPPVRWDLPLTSLPCSPIPAALSPGHVPALPALQRDTRSHLSTPPRLPSAGLLPVPSPIGYLLPSVCANVPSGPASSPNPGWAGAHVTRRVRVIQAQTSVPTLQGGANATGLGTEPRGDTGR